MRANDIVHVIELLDGVVDEKKAAADPLGYFAAMYREVTRRVLQGIEDGDFDDGDRMNKMDTAFANYYFAAIDGSCVSRPWKVAFDFAATSKPGVFQHLLLGMNAHINYDLPQAVVDVVSGPGIDDVHQDYDRINDILLRLLNPVQEVVETFIFGAATIDVALGNLDESFAGWSVEKARAHAWVHARELALVDAPADKAPIIAHLEGFATDLAATKIANPGLIAGLPFRIARGLERTDVRAIVEALEGLDQW